MNSTVPVRLLFRTVCLVVLLLSTEAGAGIDSPGRVSFDFLAEFDAVYQRLDQVPEDAPLSYVDARAYFSTDASSFEDTGVRIWVSFWLGDPDGGQGRHAMLILDLDLRDPYALRAEYLETRNDCILFEGYPVDAEVRILDAWLDDDGDAGTVEGEFEYIFMDPSDPTEGSRVLLAGLFVTDAMPQGHPSDTDTYHEPAGYVETGCGSEVYVDEEDEDSGCEGDTYDSDYEDTGCGGSDDDYDYGGSSDCEGDGYDSDYSDSGCEGDTYDSSYSDSSSCEGDSYDSYDSDYDSADCEGDEAYAAVLKPAPRRRRRPNPLRAIMRMFPEIAGISFIVYMKRRHRAGRWPR